MERNQALGEGLDQLKFDVDLNEKCRAISLCSDKPVYIHYSGPNDPKGCWRVDAGFGTEYGWSLSEALDKLHCGALRYACEEHVRVVYEVAALKSISRPGQMIFEWNREMTPQTSRPIYVCKTAGYEMIVVEVPAHSEESPARILYNGRLIAQESRERWMDSDKVRQWDVVRMTQWCVMQVLGHAEHGDVPPWAPESPCDCKDVQQVT